MDGQAQPADAGDLVRAPEQAGRVAALGAGDVEADHAHPRVEVLRFRYGLPGQDLGDVGSVLPHRDDDQAELHRVTLGGVVHAGEHGPDGLAGGEAGEGVDDRRVAQLQRGHPRRGRLVHDGLGDLADVLVELGDPQRVVHLVEVGEEGAFLVRLQLQPRPHLGEGLHGVEPVVLHELPRHLGRDRAVDVLVQFDLGQGPDLRFQLRHGSQG